MRAAIYARVSTQSQEQRGTIGSQLAALRERVSAEGDELVSEFTDNGHSGARLDRPGLDAMRDAAEIGLVEVVWCLSPDRLAPSTPTKSSCSTNWLDTASRSDSSTRRSSMTTRKRNC